MLQITSQFAECSKNLIGEVVMTGAGMKLLGRGSFHPARDCCARACPSYAK